MQRLREKFSEFHRNREILSGILGDYTADYRQSGGNVLERQEFLREKYSKRVPKFNHLVWNDDDDSELWTAADIAIVLGRERSSVTRTLAKIERSEGWRSKLLAIRHSSKSENGLTIYSYTREIFTLIIDRYEEEYLQRFANPRHGKSQDITEIKRFWEYLKQSAESEKLRLTAEISPEIHELPDIPPMTWNDIMSLIWRKIFTVRTGTFFTVIFAFSFEIARRYSFTKPYFTAGAVIILTLSALMIRFRKWRVDVLSDIGAGALLFAILWTVGISSHGLYAASVKNTNRDFLMQESKGWVEAYRINDEIFVAVIPVMYSDIAGDVKELVYGINSQPDKVIRRENLRDYYEKITSTKSNDIQYVTSRLRFIDGTESEVRRNNLTQPGNLKSPGTED